MICGDKCGVCGQYFTHMSHIEPLYYLVIHELPQLFKWDHSWMFENKSVSLFYFYHYLQLIFRCSEFFTFKTSRSWSPLSLATKVVVITEYHIIIIIPSCDKVELTTNISTWWLFLHINTQVWALMYVMNNTWMVQWWQSMPKCSNFIKVANKHRWWCFNCKTWDESYPQLCPKIIVWWLGA